MAYLFGLIIASACLVLSAIHLGQQSSNYFDYVAFMMVLGGTLAVGIVILPWKYWREIIGGVFWLFVPRRISHKKLLLVSIDLVESIGQGQAKEIKFGGLPGDILKEGTELITLGLKTDLIESILRERVYQAGLRSKQIGSSFTSWAKYPPAFGLAGTVLGLISLMNAISLGADAKETGTQMAIALIATFYGLLVANLVINPAGENIMKRALEDERAAELALQAILIASDGGSVLEAQEMLNSFVTKGERVNVIKDYRSDGGKGEAA